MELKQIIKACIKGNRKAQKELYQKYSPMLFAVIKRYIKNDYDAEDVLIDTFMKIYDNLSKFKKEGSFEAWIRKIAVRESLMFLRRNKVFKLFIEADNLIIPDKINIVDELNLEDLLKALDLLPVGYRTVFNLYVIEGYKHREIAEQLNISINTSKSQLRLAKERMQKLIKEQNIVNTG
ncbi:MAG TPA: RNA polymerase sigma factor [Bacteroidetes bacterium]|nr:RNA polymerase sigma factor [Bacteroidota bacterium]